MIPCGLTRCYKGGPTCSQYSITMYTSLGSLPSTAISRMFTIFWCLSDFRIAISRNALGGSSSWSSSSDSSRWIKRNRFKATILPWVLSRARKTVPYARMVWAGGKVNGTSQNSETIENQPPSPSTPKSSYESIVVHVPTYQLVDQRERKKWYTNHHWRNDLFCFHCAAQDPLMLITRFEWTSLWTVSCRNRTTNWEIMPQVPTSFHADVLY